MKKTDMIEVKPGDIVEYAINTTFHKKGTLGLIISANENFYNIETVSRAGFVNNSFIDFYTDIFEI